MLFFGKRVILASISMNMILAALPLLPHGTTFGWVIKRHAFWVIAVEIIVGRVYEVDGYGQRSLKAVLVLTSRARDCWSLK